MTNKVDFWHTLNLAMSDKERDAFNKWVYRLRERAIVIDMKSSMDSSIKQVGGLRADIKEMTDAIVKIPFFYK